MSERAPNYVTREGAKKLQNELAQLRSRQRPKVVQEVADAAAQGDRSENAEYIYGKRKLREIDRRIHWLTKRLESATVVEAREGAADQVFFGAFVEVEDEEGKRAKYRIVGEDNRPRQRTHFVAVSARPVVALETIGRFAPPAPSERRDRAHHPEHSLLSAQKC